MRKSFVLLVVLSILLCGCKSKEERELEQARKAAEAAREVAEQAQENYDKLTRDLDRYNSLIDRVQNAK